MAACDALEYYAKRSKRLLADRTLPVHLLKNKKLLVGYRNLILKVRDFQLQLANHGVGLIQLFGQSRNRTRDSP